MRAAWLPISIIASLIADAFHTVKWWLVLGAAARQLKAIASTHTHTCKQWFVTVSVRKASLALDPCGPLRTLGGPGPVNDKPVR